MKVMLGLVHNNNTERTDQIRPGLTALAAHLGETCEVLCQEFAEQPPLVPHSRWRAFRRDLSHAILERHWARYRERPIRGFGAWARFLSRSIDRYVRDPSGGGEGRRRTSAIEVYLTDKHIRAWQAALEAGADFAIVFEDDAVFLPESIDLVASAIARLAAAPADRVAFVDLAGGLPWSNLGVDRLADGREGRIVRFRKPVTNTACCYLLNRAMMGAFVAHLLDHPRLRMITSDWLINAMLIALERRGAATLCFHHDPPALAHGSTTGRFGSTLR